MYQFSRSIYRELADDVMPDRTGDVTGERQRFLRACEASMERLALDRHYFAKPVKTLFHDVRSFFPITQQMHVYRVVKRHVELAKEYVDEQAREGVTFEQPALLPREHAQGDALPAGAAAGEQVLPVAQAPRGGVRGGGGVVRGNELRSRERRWRARCREHPSGAAMGPPPSLTVRPCRATGRSTLPSTPFRRVRARASI